MSSAFRHSHNYPLLIQRWRRVARAAGLRFRPFSSAGGYEMFVLCSRKSPTGGVYLSAGIHGDEPASTEGLLHWAESNTAILRELPCMIFPCLNPWGLVNNSRLDEAGLDLNRLFQHEEVPFIRALKEAIKPHWFAMSAMLHEDYDGQGLYLYEVQRRKPFWGEALLEAVRPLIPIDPRTFIDGRRISKPGILRRKINLKDGEFTMLPEAVYLHQYHSERTFTFETPSEFALDQRTRVQAALVSECVRLFAANRDAVSFAKKWKHSTKG